MAEKLNIVTVEGFYKITCSSCTHNPANDILFVLYQGKSYQATIDINGNPLSDEGNYYSLTFELKGIKKLKKSLERFASLVVP